MLNAQQHCFRLYPLDFGMLVGGLDQSDPSQWKVEQIWYSGAFYTSADDLIDKYDNVASTHKTKVEYVHTDPKLKTTQAMRGDPMPENPQRPPVQVI